MDNLKKIFEYNLSEGAQLTALVHQLFDKPDLTELARLRGLPERIVQDQLDEYRNVLAKSSPTSKVAEEGSPVSVADFLDFYLREMERKWHKTFVYTYESRLKAKAVIRTCLRDTEAAQLRDAIRYFIEFKGLPSQATLPEFYRYKDKFLKRAR